MTAQFPLPRALRWAGRKPSETRIELATRGDAIVCPTCGSVGVVFLTRIARLGELFLGLWRPAEEALFFVTEWLVRVRLCCARRGLWFNAVGLTRLDGARIQLTLH